MITVIIINSNDRIRLGIKYPIRGYANEFPSIDMSIMQLTRTNTRNRKQPKIKDTIEFKRFIKHSTPPEKLVTFHPASTRHQMLQAPRVFSVQGQALQNALRQCTYFPQSCFFWRFQCCSKTNPVWCKPMTDRRQLEEGINLFCRSQQEQDASRRKPTCPRASAGSFLPGGPPPRRPREAGSAVGSCVAAIRLKFS